MGGSGGLVLVGVGAPGVLGRPVGAGRVGGAERSGREAVGFEGRGPGRSPSGVA
ncbi:hypothetical protein GA0115246_102261, partial [Streptomyces sp. SolWspMP-sol7th]